MGQSPSKDPALPAVNPSTPPKTEDLVDYGSLLPQGIYPASASDFDYRTIRRLIYERRIAPFYKGLADEPEDLLDLPLPPPDSPDVSPIPSPTHSTRERTASGAGWKGKDRETIAARQRIEAHRKLYANGAAECPICFLYYPDNTNHSRCCDQPICTECFVQIRRPPDSPATPASCPFCVEPNFGVTYHPPEWALVNTKRTVTSGVTSASMSREGSAASARSFSSTEKQRRRKSLNYKDPEVVTIDMIRPDWNRSLLDVPLSRPGSRRNSATSANNSNTSNAMPRRLVGRPGPAYLSSSSSRTRASSAGTEYGGYMAAMRHMNMDLEELMVMEAIRMSLLEEEARETREREERAGDPSSGDTIVEEGTEATGEVNTDAQDDGSGRDHDATANDDDEDDADDDDGIRAEPTITISEYIDDSSSSSASPPPSWGSRNKAMPQLPAGSAAAAAASSVASLDFKAPIQEVAEVEQAEDHRNVF